ncbi:hypothetical protein BDP27DRAFT_1216306 [Rhodocollybia butyracea]|uniref:Uncharacterized protein n=1 Tax=Rhodocollybia butyracea TaxID=206335 RepID=A0A9P5Q0D7_9AGAR|nr:hypothetical protein BDP27DRAFT_1216306 [Rhodocollybia butyracea]
MVSISTAFEHYTIVPFGVTYEKIGTIQRRLAWPLHKDDTLSRSGRSTDLNIYFLLLFYFAFVLSRSLYTRKNKHLPHAAPLRASDFYFILSSGLLLRTKAK